MRVSGKYLRIVVAIILVGCLSFAQAAQVALEYTGTPRTFKVCALAVEQSDGSYVNSHPLIFEGLRRCPEKPAGWDFENPLAAPQIVSGLGNLTKADAAYWIVNSTDVTAASLQGMDLVYICAPEILLRADLGHTNEREALIKACRGGTIIWVDQTDVGGAGTTVTGFAPPGSANSNAAAFTFSTGGTDTGNTRRAINSHAWLLQNPFNISSAEVPYIGRYPTPSDPTTGPTCDGIGGGFDCQPILRDNDGSNTYRNVTVTPYGSGAIVVTAGEVGWDLESWWQATGYWWSADRLRRPSRYQLPDFKFAYNILGATSRWSQARRGPWADAKSVVEVRAPLQVEWQFPGQFESLAFNKIGPVVGSPVCAGGMVFAVTLGSPDIDGEGGQDAYLLCFDADPAQDLDGDGTADDGILDYSAGAPYDLVWEASLGAMTPRYASPCVANLVGLPGARPLQVVLVSLVTPDGSGPGEVRCYNASLDPWTLGWVSGSGYNVSYETTGALMWTYDIDGYDTDSDVVALSTPVVYQNYVYVLASEFDSSLDGSTVNSTYGRAHCFQLSYEWDVDTNGPKWVFPDPNTDPAEDGDDASDSGAPDDHAFAELQGMLPPFHEPQWVAGIAPYNSPAPRPLLPPTPGAIPVPHSGKDVIADSEWQVLLNIATPVGTTFSWNAPDWDMSISGWTDLLNRTVGGYDFALIPTPTTPGTPPVDQLNLRYYSYMLLTYGLASGVSGPTDPAYTRLDSLTRQDDTGIDVSATLVNVGTTVRLYFTSGQARELLLPARQDTAGSRRPHNISLYGVPVEITYTVDTTGDGTPDTQYTQTQTLRGPMRYRPNESANRRRVTPPVITGPDSMITVSDAAEDAGRNVASASGGALRSRSRYSGGQQWQFHADTTLPNASTLSDPPFDQPYSPYGYAPLYKSAPAVDTSTDTAYVVVNHARPDPSNDTSLEGVAEVIGIATEADLSITLRPVDGVTPEPDARIREGTVSITTLDTSYDVEVAVPASAYEVDYENHTITFYRSQAGWLSTIGSLYGKPVWVDYDFCDPADPTDPGDDTTITDELHILPEVVRFQYMPGFIRLHHNFVYHNFDDSADAMNVFVSLPNGTALAGLGIGEEEFDAAGLLPGGWIDALPRGILDIRNLQIPTEAVTEIPLQPGCNFVVQYYYFDETTGSALPASETHQVPYNIGESISSPALGGRVLHVGTEGFDPNRDNTLNLTEAHNDSHAQKPFLVGERIKETLLSLLWDPISNLVYGHMAQPANPHGSYNVLGTPVIPAVSSSPVLGHNRVFVGSKMVGQITQPANDGIDPGYVSAGVGFVSALKSRSTFICDDTRIIEVVEDTPVWVCHGTLSAMPNEAVDVSRGTDGRIAIPFNRPAKAVPLSNGNLLVVDTGNNRVVEIDRDGVVKWPLSAAGYDYYTSATNTQLRLDSPSDVFRYYTITDSGVNYNSTNGDLLPSTTTHTVIADAGNGRVIDIVTQVSASGAQTHSVHVKTPSHVKAAGSTAPLQRIAYTAVRPIFDPSSTAVGGIVHPVIGYLCAASNLHQLVVVEENTLAINPPSTNLPYGGSAGSDWKWLAWLWDEDVSDTVYGPPDSLIFRNIRDLQTSYEGDDFYITVTCGQYAGRLSDVQANNLHPLAAQGDGIFEFCVDISGAAGTWALIPAVDGAGIATPDTPIWYMTREDYIYSYPAASVRRDLSNIRYLDVDDNPYWQTMPWFPVSAVRLPCDTRPMDADGDGTLERYHRHLITNYAGLIPNLTRENIDDTSAPASLYSSVIVVQTDDANDNYPGDDTLDIDRRLVTPNPNEADWPDPLAQPTHAAR